MRLDYGATKINSLIYPVQIEQKSIPVISVSANRELYLQVNYLSERYPPVWSIFIVGAYPFDTKSR